MDVVQYLQELLTATSTTDKERYYTSLTVDGRKVKFMLDCGATVNLIPKALIDAIGRAADIRPAPTNIRMFDHTPL